MFDTKILFVALLYTTVVYSCERNTFNNVKVRATTSFTLMKNPDIQFEEDKALTGCITPSDELKKAVKIAINNEEVPILYEGAVQDMETLYELDLQNNSIKEIQPNAFQNNPILTTIILSSNKIEKIPENVFNNLEVKILLLDNNKISDIAPGAFDDMPNLYKIDLSHNRLKEWNSKWFTNTPGIWRLHATFNQITSLPDEAFKNFKGKHKDARNNDVIASFYLSSNRIEEISSTAFQGLKQLEFLDLDNNEIEFLDHKVFSGFDSIKYLMLNNNRLTCWNRIVLNALPASEEINVSDNPFDCDCLKKMKKWARDRKVNLRMTVRAIECMQKRIEDVLDSVKDIN